jgi:hypothetical protein
MGLAPEGLLPELPPEKPGAEEGAGWLVDEGALAPEGWLEAEG